MTASIPPISRLSTRIIRILGCNPGPMTLQGTNTYLIGTGERRVLLDTGEKNNSQYAENLKKVLKEENVVISDIIISHWHHDHIGGISNVIDVNGQCQVFKFKSENPEQNSVDKGIELKFLNDGDEIFVEGASIMVHHTPGHTTDHLVLVMLEDAALFSGDCILGEGTAVFEDLTTYMKSLETILALKPQVIYPGHGPAIYDPIPKISFYINHRMEREKQILEFIKKNSGKKVTARQIVKNLYKGTPFRLYPAAEVNVTHHLRKLELENKVRREGGGYVYVKSSL